MHTVLILKGLPASGKSTWAKDKVSSSNGAWKRINKDDLRAMVDGGFWSKNNEHFIRQLRDAFILQALDQGRNVIVDDTNLNPVNEEQIRALVNDYCNSRNATIEVQTKEFHLGVEECIERDAQRTNPVGEKVILDMARRWLKPFVAQTPNPTIDPKKKRAIICDMDGTLAIIGDRSPYDASKCDELDTLNVAVAETLSLYSWKSYRTIIILSGRDSEYREATERFLAKHGVSYDYLWMRNHGDNRKDCIIKKELYYQHVHPHYNVTVWFDDRNQIVDMVRKELHIPCFQVNYGDF